MCEVCFDHRKNRSQIDSVDVFSCNNGFGAEFCFVFLLGFRFQFRSFARITGTLLLEAMVDSNGGMVNDRKLITKYNNRSESAVNDHHMMV